MSSSDPNKRPADDVEFTVTLELRVVGPDAHWRDLANYVAIQTRRELRLRNYRVASVEIDEAKELPDE